MSRGTRSRRVNAAESRRSIQSSRTVQTSEPASERRRPLGDSRRRDPSGWHIPTGGRRNTRERSAVAPSRMPPTAGRGAARGAAPDLRRRARRRFDRRSRRPDRALRGGDPPPSDPASTALLATEAARCSATTRRPQKPEPLDRVAEPDTPAPRARERAERVRGDSPQTTAPSRSTRSGRA